MQQLRPVIWSKGTLLTPQHLQLQDRFVESVLSFHLRALSVQPYGFKDVLINRESLSKGSFALVKASGIFPDGLLFSMPDSDSTPDSRRIQLEKNQETTDIFMAIPRYRDRGTNVAIHSRAGGGDPQSTRYRSEVTIMRDETSAGSEKPVALARKNFRLLTSDDSQEGCECMRIARVRRGKAANSFEIDPQIVPPLIDIGASPYLDTLVKELLQIMAAKGASLASMRSQKNQVLADFSASDIQKFWLLYTINTYLPLLRHIGETRRGHPAYLFDLLLSMAGALTTFSEKIQPSKLPIYDHDNLGECFGKLDEIVRELLEYVVRDNFVSLQCKFARRSVYATALSDDRYLKDTVMYLAIKAEMNDADLISRVQRQLKVSSNDRLEELMKQALPGVPLSHQSNPRTIPINLSYKYFVLDQTHNEWDFIRRSRHLAVYIPDDFVNPDMQLWIVMPEAR